MTTDLHKGKLQILGSSSDSADATARELPTLLDGLLASSCFPRRLPSPLVLGSVPDLLRERLLHRRGHHGQPAPGPLGAFHAAEGRRLAKQKAGAKPFTDRPATAPHLILTASLEVDPPNLELDDRELDLTAKSWMRLRRRVKQLSYNVKIDRFAAAQVAFDALFSRDTKAQQPSNMPAWRPLWLKVITIKPKWLCKTFAFHSLLGFRQSAQAESIAHGCASTFAHFAGLARVGKGVGRRLAAKCSRPPER